ncbi:hypothetical protein JRO89_XS01G0022600 [Xanthoceras sorbifolium]|uniref:Glycosyltransferase n=1 Tax=Xanthoceras sorbifolium TaxID=99658 RepID=A0ABQ8IIM7_9ROSI|nr:hypothetical protein JRO89_XS01G0022600 [Xanthoceras sorbifolium]
MSQQTPHVVIVPSPGIGHLVPFIEFAKHLVQHHKFRVTCIIPTVGSPSDADRAALSSLPPTINHVFLPPIVVSFDDHSTAESNENTNPLIFAVTRSLPPLRDVLKSLMSTTHVVAFVADLFSTVSFDVAFEFNLTPYLFFPSNAMALSFVFYLPKLDEMVSCEFKDLPEPVQIPGCVPVHGRDLLEPVQNRQSEVYRWFFDITKRHVGLAKGIIVNTFMDMEARALKALLEEPGKPPVYPIGPLTRVGSSDPDDVSGSNCLTWLDDQPSRSVLFVSFGSGGTLSRAQLNELAFGLEMSQQRFIWVVRTPNDESSSAAYLRDQISDQKNPLDFLPEGFLERTKDRGITIPRWGQQVQILSHGSTGGFLTHCGWNSVLESVVNGVPLLAWPLYSEQKMNAVMLVKDLKVALMRPKPNEEDGLVIREEIAKVVKELMEGEEGKRVRKPVKDLMNAASKSLMEDGSSIKHFQS